MRNWGLASTFNLLIAGFAAVSAQAHEGPLTDATQDRIVQLYSADRCEDVRKIVQGVALEGLRPNVLALVASCDPPGHDAEALFQRAEELNPTGDLIFTLHARHRHRTDPKGALALWQKVLMVARNFYFRDLAKAYLAGVVEAEENSRPLKLTSQSLFARVFVGASYRRNMLGPDFNYLPRRDSPGADGTLELAWRRWLPFGSVGVRFDATYDYYFRHYGSSLWSNALTMPLAVQVAPAKDVIFRPVVGYSQLGGKPLQFKLGLAAGAVVYQAHHTQSVQGTTYFDRVLWGELSRQQGAHYRFEYQWEFFPGGWDLLTNLFVEHVSSSRTDLMFGYRGIFNTAHTDAGARLRIERDFGRFTLGVEPLFMFRADSDDTTFQRKRDGATMSKGREDWTLSARATVSVPLFTSLQLYGWYDFQRVFSNIDAEDYVDRNYLNHIVTLGLRTSFSSY